MSQVDSTFTMTQLPDGSGCFSMNFPLPVDHWIYQKAPDGFLPIAPNTFLKIINPGQYDTLSDKIREIAQYVIQVSTNCGRAMDFDPDAMVQNFTMALLGQNPDNVLSTTDVDNTNTVTLY